MMAMPSWADSFEVLLLQAADQGRGELLFGDSLRRARTTLRPFMVGDEFPSVYFEFPLKGDPFLDVTVVYHALSEDARIDSTLIERSRQAIAWFVSHCRDMDDVSFGFEVDSKCDCVPAAAIHFQPREHVELVVPFCEALGEPERGRLYEEVARNMPEGWPLSALGLFQGRPDAPLRISGYLDGRWKQACAQGMADLTEAFDRIGFASYGRQMIAEASQLLSVAPGTVELQFDVCADGRIGDTFAFDVQFDTVKPAQMVDAFERGPSSRVMELLEEWKIVDGRWRQGIAATFARAIPVALEGGCIGCYAFIVMPQWLKVRWRDGVLQPSKLYLHATTSLFTDKDEG